MSVSVSSLVAAAGGEVAGKIRLQKLVYLLQQLGLGTDFEFGYRHYGPYSEHLAETVEDDIALNRLEVLPRRRQKDGVPYVIYKAKDESSRALDRYRPTLEQLNQQSGTILELAATIHWLAVVEGLSDWHGELTRRKGIKAEGGRDAQALGLLEKLGLPPGTSSTSSRPT